MTYHLRLMFDAGSGVCLWAHNDAARAVHGIPVDHWQLPMSENTKRWLDHLVAWFDTSLDWSNPAAADDRWSALELQRFLEAKERALVMLREDLPRSYTITESHRQP